MGRPKALLLYAGGTFVSTVARGLLDAGLRPVVVVIASGDASGVAADELAAALAGADLDGVRVVRNPAPERGQLSSLQCALADPGLADAPYAIVALADHPAVRPETYRALAFMQDEEPAAAHVPLYGWRRGHPVAFPRPLLDQLRALPPSASAEPVVDAFHPLIEVPLDDAGVVTDVDTPADLARLEARE
jgi:CTP:molybdopterin cytidylyltransferase MocA